MLGWMLDFSVQENKGLITTETGERYTFTGRDWQDSGIPQKGMRVNFELAGPSHVVSVYRVRADVGGVSSSSAAAKSQSAYSPVDWSLLALRNYANFNGRSERCEYWFYLLGVVVIIGVLSVMDAVLFGRDSVGLLVNTFVLFSLVPSIAVAVRRLHDIDKSGWWLLIALIPFLGVFMLLFWAACQGDRGPNAYGDPPG